MFEGDTENACTGHRSCGKSVSSHSNASHTIQKITLIKGNVRQGRDITQGRMRERVRRIKVNIQRGQVGPTILSEKTQMLCHRVPEGGVCREETTPQEIRMSSPGQPLASENLCKLQGKQDTSHMASNLRRNPVMRANPLQQKLETVP